MPRDLASGDSHFLSSSKTRQVVVDPGGTTGLRRLEEVFDHPTYLGRPGTPRELVALHIGYK
jgi:hypothetical protein